MAKIVTITNPLTGQPAQVDQLDHTAQQIDDGLNIARGVSNPNLLDNWYFGNPINQRGQTSYTGSGYGIDRWIFDGENASMLIEGSGLHFVFSASATGSEAIHQRFENPGRYSGKAVTYSMLGSTDHSFGMLLLVNGSIFGSVNSGVVAGETIFSYTAVLPDNITSLEAYYYPKTASGAGEAYLRGCKLELGTAQTLAHQENGVWQLNEIPNYGEQLARCQRYFYAVNTEENQYACFGTGVAFSSTKAYITVPIPVKMRAYPGITKQGSLALFLNGDYTAIAVSAISAARGSMQGLFELEVTASGLTPGATYYLAANTDGAARLFFNSDL